MLLLKGELLLPRERNTELSMQALHPTTSPCVLCSSVLDVSYALSAPDLISHMMGCKDRLPLLFHRVGPNLEMDFCEHTS